MTCSPGPSAPTPAASHRSAAVVWIVVMFGAGLAGGAAAAPFAASPERADRESSVETRVAGISIERSSVDATAEAVATTTVPAPAAPEPAATVPATVPATAAPTTTVPPAPPAEPPAAPEVAPEVAMRDQVLAAISFPWQQRLPGWRIEFLPERKGYRGSTFPSKHLIQIYLRDGLTLADYVHVAAHELGHAVDVTLLDDDDHELWNETRGRDADAAWWVESGADDFSSGAGDWAESFAWSQLPSGRFYSHIGPPPTDEQLAVLRDIVG